MPLNIERVHSLVPGREIRWYPTIDSTMHEAVRLAREGCPSGTVVGADEQTAGHGRYGRVWHSEAESGLYFSIVLRLALDPGSMSVITFALGLAVAEAIQSATGIACDLRWPNDVLVQDRKCAGILTQLHGTDVVSGIGVNVNQAAFPADVARIATSLHIASGREQSREGLLIALLDGIDRHCDILTMQGPAAILHLFTRASSYVMGRRVTVDLADGCVTGTTAGLTEAGFLRLRRDDGGEETIVAGGVRPAEV
jgi:BirA family transcriptional regulator, biotin operon repressor / biotin---[acetyl-CoA-carboxylase] ligase